MLALEIYVWGMVICQVAFVRPHRINELREWAACGLLAAAWPMVVAIRLHRRFRSLRRLAR